MIKRLRIPKIGTICEINWLDASGKMKEELEKINDVLPSSLLIQATTYGEIYKVDDKAILILQEKSDTECDYTVIPISWVINIKNLKKKNGN